MQQRIIDPLEIAGAKHPTDTGVEFFEVNRVTRLDIEGAFEFGFVGALESGDTNVDNPFTFNYRGATRDELAGPVTRIVGFREAEGRQPRRHGACRVFADGDGHRGAREIARAQRFKFRCDQKVCRFERFNRGANVLLGENINHLQ